MCVTHIATIFGLNPQGEAAVLPQDESNRYSAQQIILSHYPQLIAWHGIEIPVAAQQPIHAASKLRDDVRQQVLSHRGNVDYGVITKLAHDFPLSTQLSTPADSDNRFYVAATRFHNDIQSLASESAPAKDILNLCDAFRDFHLYILDIYHEDRENAPALVWPLDSSLRKVLAEKRAAAGEMEKARSKADKAEKQLARDS